MTFDQWLELGMDEGFVVGEVFCSTHEVPPGWEDEIEEYDDPCFLALRVSGG